MVFWQADKKMNIILHNDSSDLSVKNNPYTKFLNPPNPLFQRGDGSISPFSKGSKGGFEIYARFIPKLHSGKPYKFGSEKT